MYRQSINSKILHLQMDLQQLHALSKVIQHSSYKDQSMAAAQGNGFDTAQTGQAGGRIAAQPLESGARHPPGTKHVNILLHAVPCHRYSSSDSLGAHPLWVFPAVAILHLKCNI